MKGNKGITLTSLIIYIIGMMIVVALISTLTAFFSKNIKMIERGSHEELLEQKGRYYRLYTGQFELE